MAILDPRTAGIECWFPSVRYTFANEAAALADSPQNGDIYAIAGVPFWWDGTEFQPFGCCPLCEAIPAAAFADTLNPTNAEALIWVTANFPDAHAGSLFYFEDAIDPLYVWGLCPDGSLLLIESPNNTIRAAIEVVDPNPENFITDSGNSWTTCPGGDITLVTWTISHGGVVAATITGAPAADASGEADVVSGTYQTPHWEASIFDGSCGDLDVLLSVTDTCGLTDNRTITVEGFGLVELVFLNDGTGGVDGVFNVTLNLNSGTATWDMGDGTIIVANNPAHVYATPGVYTAVASFCPRDLVGISSLADDGLIGDFDSIFSRTSLTRFQTLETFRIIDSVGFHGQVPNLTEFPVLDVFIAQGTSVSGNVPLFPATITQVDMQNNLLDGVIQSLAGRTLLENYRVDDNQLIGNLPDLSTNTLLQIFTANNNLLDGSIQDTTGLAVLTRYEVENNLLTGNIFDVLATENPLLERYNVSRNQLTGDLPDLTGLTSLSLYHVDRNLFTQVLPLAYFSTNSGLTNVDMSQNQMTGVFPTVATSTGLAVYFVNNNQITGTVPLLTANTVLTTIAWASNTDIDYVAGRFSATNGVLVTVNANNASMLTAEVDNLIIDVELAGTSNGTLNWSGQAASSAASAVAQGLLTGRGWLLIGA